MTTHTLTESPRATTRRQAPAWLTALLATDGALAPVVLRLALAVVIFPHGAQKALGWWGGYGLEGTLGYFTQTLGVPAPLALLVIATEFLGPIALVLGLATRFTAAGLGATMVGAIAMVHAPFGFFMNWSGAQGGEGFEFHLLVLGIAAALVVAGGGRWSLDRLVSRTLPSAAKPVTLAGEPLAEFY